MHESARHALDETAKLRDLHERLRLIRIYVAAMSNPALTDLDALLSVAEAEVERAMAKASPEQ